MWQNNLQVLATFASNNSQNAWANLSGLGWRKIGPNAADGVTNLFQMMNSARANGRPVNVFIDGTNQVTIAYLL
jgi:hypothetical protein